jgi:hypothetical protein
MPGPLLIFRSPFQSGDRTDRDGLRVAARKRRSWWSVRYTDGTVLSEWERDPGSANGHRDWLRIPSRGMQAIRLYCPNGTMAALGDTSDATGTIFQLKVSVRSVAISDGRQTMIDARRVLAHVIGKVTAVDGTCLLYSWEILPRPEFHVKLPERPDPNSDYFRTAAPGTLARAYDRWQQGTRAIQSSPEYAAWQADVRAWDESAQGRLVGPIQDNVHFISYQMIGKLEQAHLGLTV